MTETKIQETKVKERVIYDGNFLKLQKDDVLLPSNQRATREFVVHPGAACVLAFDENQDVLLVKQFRYPIGEVLLEIPAGKIDLGEAPIDCAKRELEEETGYRAGELELLGVMHPAAAYTTEKIYIYLAKNLKKTQTNFDEDEFLIPQKMKFDRLVEQILNDQVSDAKTQIAVLKYLAKYKY